MFDYMLRAECDRLRRQGRGRLALHIRVMMIRFRRLLRAKSAGL
jgi:hypothetical protein